MFTTNPSPCHSQNLNVRVFNFLELEEKSPNSSVHKMKTHQKFLKCCHSGEALFSEWRQNNSNLAKPCQKYCYLYSKCVWVGTWAQKCSCVWRGNHVALHPGAVRKQSACEFIGVSVLSLGLVGFVKNNPHLEVVCRAGFPNLVWAPLKRSGEAGRGLHTVRDARRKKSKARTQEGGERVGMKTERERRGGEPREEC